MNRCLSITSHGVSLDVDKAIRIPPLKTREGVLGMDAFKEKTHPLVIGAKEMMGLRWVFDLKKKQWAVW